MSMKLRLSDSGKNTGTATEKKALKKIFVDEQGKCKRKLDKAA
jgi:hypothetical protein